MLLRISFIHSFRSHLLTDLMYNVSLLSCLILILFLSDSYLILILFLFIYYSYPDALGQQEQFDPDRKETELSRHHLSDMSDYKRDSDLELMDADYAEIDTSAIMEDGQGRFSIFSSGESK